MQVGDLIDMHAYVGPNAPLPTLKRAAVLGEFGGLGLRLEGHLWIPEDSVSYEMMQSPAQLEASFCFRFLGISHGHAAALDRLDPCVLCAGFRKVLEQSSLCRRLSCLCCL